jgi:hypothetical protein
MGAKLALPCVVACFLSACSYSYVDDDGARHVFGFVYLEIEPTENSESLAGTVFDITSVGVAYHSTPENSSFTIGYSRSVTAGLRNHVLVKGNPLTALDTKESIQQSNGKSP